MSSTPNKPISMASINTALNYGSSSRISLNDSMVRRLQVASSGIACGTPTPGSSYISMDSLRNKPGPDPSGTYESFYCSSGYTLNYVYSNGNYGTYVGSSTPNSTSCGYVPIIPGNMIFTSGSGTVTIPQSVGPTINVAVIGGGGGGGGGSGRTSWAGFFDGGGGGGGGGIAISYNVPVTAGQTIGYIIGGGGGGGAARDGVYSGGSNGGPGGDSEMRLDGVTYAYARGGQPGGVAPSGVGGAGGGTVAGAAYGWVAGSGTRVTGSTTAGGQGSYGIIMTPNYSSPLGNGYYRYDFAYGAYGNGNLCTQNSGVYPAAGTGYGAGGSGGGCSQSDVYNYNNMIASAGRGGCVFIWWGY